MFSICEGNTREYICHDKRSKRFVSKCDRSIDADRIRARSNRQMASRTLPLSGSAVRDWPRRLPRGGAARVGIGRHGHRASRRFVVVVFTPRCLKPSSRVPFRSGLERRARVHVVVVSCRETKTKSSAANDGRWIGQERSGE